MNPSIYKIGAPSIAVHDQFLDEFRKSHASAAHEIFDCVGDRRKRLSATKESGELFELTECTLAIEYASGGRRSVSRRGLGALRRRSIEPTGGRLGIDAGERRRMRSEPIEYPRKGLPQAGKRRSLRRAACFQRSLKPSHRVKAGQCIIGKIADELRWAALKSVRKIRNRNAAFAFVGRQINRALV